jgi:uncharacterized membrane protein
MNNEEGRRPERAGEREEKRAQFAEPAKKGLNTKFVVAVLALACVAGYLVFAGFRRDDVAAPARVAEVKTNAAPGTDAGEVRVPLKDLEGGKAVFFEPRLAGGKSVRFFVVKAADNTYRAALDACEVCFHAKKGYQQKGADMICRNCGRSFPIDGIGPHNEGGCHPVALRQSIEGDAVVIKTSELEKGVSYF